MRCALTVPRGRWTAVLGLAVCVLSMQPALAEPWDDAARDARRAAADPPPRGRSITRPASREAAAAEAASAGRARAAGSWWTTLASLAAIVGMIVLGAKLWKKHGPPARALLPPEALDVLGKRVIDPRQAIYLVRLGPRILVLASTAAGLATLAEITDPVEVDLLAGLCRPAAPERAAEKSAGFSAWFERHVGRSPAGGDAQTVADHTGRDARAAAASERLRRGEEAHA